MPNRTQNRDAKAERLINEGRCHELASVPGKLWMGVIQGDTSSYTVFDVDSDVLLDVPARPTSAIPASRGCQCPAFGFSGEGNERGCAHTDAAAKLRIRSTPEDDLFRMAGGE